MILEPRDSSVLTKNLCKTLKMLQIVNVTRVMDKGKIPLIFTSDKLLSLSNVLYVPSIRKKLISGMLPNKAELKTIVGDDIIVISHSGVFVEKGYLNESMFVLNFTSETVDGN